ncbi:hypothetical protein ATY81_12950 [Rhizobium sp. R72]|nr:hypothetical protein ATY81_12950 [Rhizobium sp. R72]OWV94609.1 hypothetical protein ATY80_12950 [Rhizobium sp. R711]
MPSALLCVAPSAQADWQYTKWGMTPDQVIAAAPPESGLRWVAKSATNEPYLTMVPENIGSKADFGSATRAFTKSN